MTPADTTANGRSPRRRRGFLAGFLSGLIVAALIALALAVLNPLPSFPPEVDSGALQSPEAPSTPASTSGLTVTPAGGGIIRPATDAPHLAIPPAEGTPPPAGSPSLVPGAGN
jgi:hypothetical protein